LVAGVLWWFKFEKHPPQAALVAPLVALGRKTPIDIDVRSDAPGLRAISVRLQAGGNSYDLLSETYPKSSWRGSGLTAKRIHVEPDLLALKVPEGPVTLEVRADTYAWHPFGASPAPRLTVPATLDLTPPRIELLTTQHNVRLGGVELAVFRQSPDTVRSGIEVDKYFFPAMTGYFADSAVALAFFAIPQDLNADVRPKLIASDAAGNQREIAVPVSIKPRTFADRTLAIDDTFLARKVPEIEEASGLPIAADLVQGYLYINGELRRQNEARILELTKAATPVWSSSAFHRQSNAAPLSAFADRRTYTYRGQPIDHQTHLGYDLASLKLSPVEAAQAGKVVLAQNLGIYGNAVILDHGLGIYSLYGHLSSFTVKEGDQVTAGQTLGQTGETGLAGGDHLHFSIMLHGVHVDPVEWWDPHWLHDHVTPKLTMFPRATTAETEHTNEQAKP
ncbi:MAG TPA: M23 family metallopeptidase, partial [Candidatus Margulisiibacteriota bacterium]|nr:M23 family metallopeptidase [Candidatus Margulisiibacteriota bacterium]